MLIRALLPLCSILLSVNAFAQLPPTRISDEGGAKSVFFNLDCVGGGVTCSTSGIDATLTVPTGYTSLDFDADYVAELGQDHTWTGLQSFEGIGLAGTTPNMLAGITMTGTHSDFLGPLLSIIEYNGVLAAAAAFQSEITYSGSGISPAVWGAKVASLATSSATGLLSFTGIEASTGFPDNTHALGPGEVAFFVGANANIRSSGGTHNASSFYAAMGFYIPAFPAVTGPAVIIERGIYSEENIDLASNVRMGLDAGLASNATSYLVFNSSLSELQAVVSGVEIMALKSNALGFYGVAPVTRPAAYTQNYTTAARRHDPLSSSAVVTTAATNVSPYGYTTAAQANAIVSSINNIRVDLTAVKDLINSLIDDCQGNGLCQ